MNTTDETKGAIFAAMGKILAEFPTVGKGQKNPSQGYNYRGVDDALVAVHALLAKHNVFLLEAIEDVQFHDAGATKRGTQQVRAVLRGALNFASGEDGSFVSAALVGEGIDTGDKALMKARSNALKYAIWNTFAVPTFEKRDSEAFEDPEPKTRKKATKPVAKKAVRNNDDADTAPNLPSTEGPMHAITAACSVEELETLLPKLREYNKKNPKTAEKVRQAFFDRREALK